MFFCVCVCAKKRVVSATKTAKPVIAMKSELGFLTFFHNFNCIPNFEVSMTILNPVHIFHWCCKLNFDLCEAKINHTIFVKG